ncbi:MAG: PatB family C-S lyase [Firmicutes bacterium]|nr:PatB family C-S lyase [Bacillota bacterium]
MYDFDTVTDRKNTASLKWDVKENELPMWVADMDFKTAPAVAEALAARAAHGIFGYNIVPDEWYDAYISWWQARYGFTMEREHLIFCTGVVPAISSIVRKLTTPAENVLLLTPVYNIFFNSILNNGRNPISCPLVYRDRKYSIDFDDLERKLKMPQTTMMLLCNPHNPTGIIWDAQTLKTIGDMCRRNNVIVVSDEIHCDLAAPGKKYTPFASVSKECDSVTCIAPTKSFNIAGLQTAAVYAPAERIYNKVNRALNTDEVAEPNAFAVTAAVAAYTRGGEWLDELRAYIAENRRIVDNFIASEIPDLYLVPSDATYLLWIDCSKICGDSKALAGFIRRETGLYLSDGAQYGEGGEGFLRLNIACPKALLYDGLKRLKKAVNAFNNKNREV